MQHINVYVDENNAPLIGIEQGCPRRGQDLVSNLLNPTIETG